MKWFNQLKTLSLYEWWLILIAMVLLPLVAIILRMIGFKRTKIFMNCFIPGESNLTKLDEASMEKVYVIARMVSIAARHGLYHANCLKQSLVLWWMLALYGILSEIRFGIQNEPKESFGAHAWVECRGVVLIDTLENHQRISAFG